MTYQEPELNISGIVPSSSQTRGIQNHEVKDGDNIFRIMPPFGTNHNGLPFAEVYLHWFSDPEGQNRPLLCSKKSERFCPACEAANEVYKQGEELIREYKDGEGRVNRKAVPEEISKKYDLIMGQFDALKAQRSFLYNAMDMNNNIKILRLPKTAAEALGQKIVEAVNTLGINPLSLKNGLFFNIKRISTGPKKFNVKYEVDYVRKTIQSEGGFVQKIEVLAVPDNVINNFEKLAYDVHALHPVRTAQEIKRVMLGDVKVWEEMNAKRNAKKAAAEEVSESTTVETPVTVSASAAVNISAGPVDTTITSAKAPTSDADDIIRLKKELGIPM